MKNNYLYVGLGVLFLLAIFSILFSLGKTSSFKTSSETNTATIRVVAAENFYGNIVSQLGGNHVSVTSILSNPNTDPHEYESSVPNAVAVSQANIVIQNGLNYDTWMDKLLSASPSDTRIVLVGGQLASHPLPDNPHVWYGIDNVQTIARNITQALKRVDPKDSSEFDHNLVTFDTSLQPLVQKIADIKSKYNGAPVGLTETIYLYQTQQEGLHVLTPFAFEKAIAEGNDPAAADVKTVNDQILQKQIKVLIYNSQTVTPITTNLQNEAKSEGIPVVPVSETMPPTATYQSWMMDQLNTLEKSLQQVVQ